MRIALTLFAVALLANGASPADGPSPMATPTTLHNTPSSQPPFFQRWFNLPYPHPSHSNSDATLPMSVRTHGPRRRRRIHP
ncbi:hypothetical protein FB45DRAFT_920541 [Roridomyces roridus]|uniref:Uncharacterized protein n=1 Tax=Roridomyces roridus TaxID=1738132 RepID=A0AAD7FJ05_9AGAR|nr:hypothetical protein FB45DRAFT_920541 [Roridomyces roridus]